MTPGELSGRSCLTFRSHPGANAWRFGGPKGTSAGRVSGVMFANDGETLTAAATAGMGLVLVPLWLVGGEIKQGRLREVLAE